MAIKVIWFVDRFGINGSYKPVWLRMIHNANLRTESGEESLRPTEISVVSLHDHISGQLLTRYASRSAPTWRPDREEDIKAKMELIIRKAGPSLKAVVLASPESLAILNLHPEHATLSKLRGSVYELFGLPALVTLPMSAWFTKVSQRDMAVANYGLESADSMERSANAKTTVGLDSQRTESIKRLGLASRSAADLEQQERLGTASFLPDPASDGFAVMDSGEGGEDADSETDSDDEDEGEDNFYYVPVMTPVGKFLLTADAGKLARIVTGRAGDVFKPH